MCSQASSRGASVHPRQFECDQREGEVLGAFYEATVGRIEVYGRDSRSVEILQQRCFRLGPLVRVPASFRYQPRNRPACDRTYGLDEHLEIDTVGEAPEDLASIIARERAQGFRGFNGGSSRHMALQ